MTARPEQLLGHIRRLVEGPSPTLPSDADLLERFLRQRDEEAFAALVQRHGSMVRGVCRRLLGHTQDAEDASQAAFLVLARKAAAVRPRSALTAYLYGVARRVALKARTANARRPQRQLSAASPVDPHADPLTEVSARELLAIFEEELQRLPSAYRLPLILCGLEGRSQEEAAQQLGWTPGSVKGRLERGRARLHARLTRRGLTLGAALMAVEASRRRAAAVSTASAGVPFTAGRVDGAAAVLAERVLRGMAWSKAALVAGLLTVVLAFAGAGTVAHRMLAGAGPPPPTEDRRDEPGGSSQRVRADRHGDPLPPQAIARLGTLRFRGVRGGLAFSPDGKWLAASTEGGVTLWETTTGRAVRRIDAPAMSLSFSRDGKRLACSDNLHCHIVDVSNGKELFAVEGTHGLFAGDGKTLVTANASISPWRLHVWDARTGRQLRQWPAGEWIRELALAADGRMAAWINQAPGAVVKQAEIQIRDLEKGEKKPSIPVPPNSLPRLALSPDGKMLAIDSAKGIRLWDVTAGKEVRGWSGRVASRPVFSPDGKRLAWIGFDEHGGAAQLWTVEREGGKPRAVGGEINNFEPPCFSPDGKLLAVVTDAHVLSLRDVAGGREAVSFDAHGRPVIDLAFSADGNHVVSRGDKDIWTWQTRTGKLLRRSPLLPPGHEFVAPLLPKGYLLTGERTANPLHGRFWLRDPRTGEEVMRFEGRPDVGPPRAVAAPGGRYVAVRGRAGEMCVLDVSAGRCLYRVAEAAFGVKLSADGEVLVWYRRSAGRIEVHVHHHAAKKTVVLSDLPKGDQVKWALDKYDCMSPDGRWLLLPTEEGRLRRWDLTSGKELSPLTEALRTVWGLVWSPDARFVAVQGSASEANAIDREALRDVRLWDVRTGVRLSHLTVPNRQGGMHLLFSPDGRTLLTTDLQGVIHLWEVATGQSRGRLLGHLPFEIGALAVSADGRMLVSGGYDSQVFVWDLTGHIPDGIWRRTPLAAEQRGGAWEALASADARTACAALWQLAADPDGTVALLRQRLRPIAAAEPGRVARLIAALDADNFAERQRAERELETLEETAAAELRQTLTRKPSLEVRRRIEALLARLDTPPRGARLQALRAVEVLEQIGDPPARAVLQTLARGAPGARLTEEAKASLRRAASAAGGQ